MHVIAVGLLKHSIYEFVEIKLPDVSFLCAESSRIAASCLVYCIC